MGVNLSQQKNNKILTLFVFWTDKQKTKEFLIKNKNKNKTSNLILWKL